MAQSNESLRLAQNGETAYVIALANDAIPAEKTAATELQSYLQQISGATLPIQNENDVQLNTPQILVGAGARVKVLLPQQDWNSLGADGIVVKSVGKNLILAGGRPRGTLYAVNTFLEDTLGVRWWAPGESTIPKQSTVEIAAQNKEYTPQIKTREAFYNSLHQDPLFATRLKINGHYQRQGDELGGHNSILGFVHTFDLLLPPEKYFKDHPEWYSDPNNGGKPCTAASAMPQPQRSQLCLSNEAARLELTKNALEWIKANPQAGIISISQNDNNNRCTCDADLKIEKLEGSPSGTLLHFVNAVAANIEKVYPHFLVETLAYTYTLTPPKIVRPRQNVVIRLCSIAGDFSRPLENEANKEFYNVVEEWKEIAPRLYIWDYVANFNNVIFPHPNLRVLAPNVRFFAANNAIGLFEQGDAYSNGTGDFVQLRVWLLAHLMWNPALDQKKLEDEFLNGYYGAAAPHLRAYLETIQDAFVKSGGKLSTFQSDDSYLTLDVMNAATQDFRRASAAVAGDKVLSGRVRRERLALDHAWILRDKPLRREAQLRHIASDGPADLTAFTADFVKTAREFKAIQYREGQSFDVYADQLLARSAPPAPLPDFAKGKDATDIIDAQESTFRFHRAGELVNIVDDPQASNGRTARMTATSDEWITQYPLDESDDFLKDGSWHCYVIVRVEAKEGAMPDTVFSSGIYDIKNKITVGNLGKRLDEMSDGKYHAIDLGVHKLHSLMYFYVAPVKRDDIEAVFVDRFVLVRESAAG